nr:Ycf1 [Streptosarcina sp. YL-2023a]
MSVANAIRDYLELLNNVYDSVSGDITLQNVVGQTFVYLFGSIKYVLYYFISFQWLRDICYLPVVAPRLWASLWRETFFLQVPTESFFTFLETPSYEPNKFLVGFLNGLFLSLPISAAHVIYLRRLFIQGIPAGVASAIGIILSQFLFLAFILLGVRGIIIPWFSFEPFIYFISLFFTFKVVFDIVHERRMRPIMVHETKILFNIFLISFLLVWTEQATLFNYIGKQEKELVKKRLLLAAYYDSLREYRHLPYYKDFDDLFSGSKSYADRVYNQQFKGTLKIVRKLFSVTLDPKPNPEQKMVLKFDQPLYKNKKIDKNLNLHEELPVDKFQELQETPFLQITNPMPFYAGWDKELRKLVITNRVMPHAEASYQMRTQSIDSKKYPPLAKLLKQKPRTIQFTAYPLPATFFEENDYDTNTVLFDDINNKKYPKLYNFQDDWIYDSLPPKLFYFHLPTKGGIIWDGNDSLKFGVKDLLKKDIKKLEKSPFKLKINQFLETKKKIS